ncbi:MAG: radical SAM protein, partial [Treponemataceae bacterium]
MKKLDKLYIEITNVCNLRCAFCPESGREPGFLSIDRFKTLLSRINDKAKGLYFHLKGEPLLHPQLGDMIDLAGDAGFTVMVTTNGTLLPRSGRTLVGRKALSRLNVSLHSLEAFSGEERDAALNDILTAVSALREDTGFSAPVISLRLWNRADEEATGLLVSGIERFFSMNSGSLGGALSLARGVLVRSGITVHPAERFDWPNLSGTNHDSEIHEIGHGFCRALRDQAGILVDGTVVPCCLDGEGDIALGNIYKTAWDDI